MIPYSVVIAIGLAVFIAICLVTDWYGDQKDSRRREVGGYESSSRPATDLGAPPAGPAPGARRGDAS